MQYQKAFPEREPSAYLAWLKNIGRQGMGKGLRFLSAVICFAAVILVSGCATVPRRDIARPEGIYHVVGRGQTLWRIANTYGVDIQELIRVNRIRDPRQIGVGQNLFIPGARNLLPVEPFGGVSVEKTEQLVRIKQGFSKWRYITVHHSGTLSGNAACFDNMHRARKMGGLFYHFVIGNGTDSGDGEVEVGWRWRQQKPVNRPFDIQICLVGDFNRQQITEAQFKSLVELINILSRQYNISLDNIRRHKDVGKKATECPGANFPFRKLLRELRGKVGYEK